MPDDTPRPVSCSLVEMTELVLPEDSNPRGSAFGGRVLALIDKCAAVAAMRHARTEVLTAGMDSVRFDNAVRVGDILVLRGRINAVFRSSMEVEVEVHAEDPLSGERRRTTRAFVTMVAVDEAGRPKSIRPLRLESDDDRRRAEEAGSRRAVRLTRREDAGT